MAFRIGQQVVCVDVAGLFERSCLDLIRLGGIYTIIAFGTNPNKDLLGRSGKYAVHLKEVNRPCGAPYGIYRFRPVIERKTDISIFTAMLDPSKQMVDAQS